MYIGAPWRPSFDVGVAKVGRKTPWGRPDNNDPITPTSIGARRTRPEGSARPPKNTPPTTQPADPARQPRDYRATYVGRVFPAARGALSRKVERDAELPLGHGASKRRRAHRPKYEIPTPLLGQGPPNISLSSAVSCEFRLPLQEFFARRILAYRLSSHFARNARPPSTTSPEDERSLRRLPRPSVRGRELKQYLGATCNIG